MSVPARPEGEQENEEGVFNGGFSVRRAGVRELVSLRGGRLQRTEPAVFCGAVQRRQELVGAQGLHAPVSQRARGHGVPGTHLCLR